MIVASNWIVGRKIVFFRQKACSLQIVTFVGDDWAKISVKSLSKSAGPCWSCRRRCCFGRLAAQCVCWFESALGLRVPADPKLAKSSFRQSQIVGLYQLWDFVSLLMLQNSVKWLGEIEL